MTKDNQSKNNKKNEKTVKRSKESYCVNKSYSSGSLLISIFEIAQLIFGVLIFYKLGLLAALIYLVFFIAVSVYFYYIKCRNCFYYGGDCVDGKIAKILFRNKPEKKKSIRLLNSNKSLIILDYLKALLPLLGAAYITFLSFEKGILLIAFYFLGWMILSNLLVRRKCICCKQGKISCGAKKATLTLIKKESPEKNNRNIKLNIIGLVAVYLWVFIYLVLPIVGISTPF